MRISVSEYMARASRWRSQLMGFAIACILFFHSGIRITEPWNFCFNLLWGVDVFFFCTGLGVHRSLSNNPDAIAFYKRRFRRIYPAYLPVVLVFFAPLAARAFASGRVRTTLQQLLGNVLLFGWVNELDYQFNWYPQAIALVYFAAPALFAAVRCCGARRWRLAALFAFFVVTQPCFFNGNLLILWSRMPCFMMGLIGAELAARGCDKRVSTPLLCLLFLAGNYLMYFSQRFPTELLWGYGLTWYPGILIVPGAMLILPWLFGLFERVGALRWINRLLAVMGKWSFEIFLVHVLLFTLINEFGIAITDNLTWLAVIAASVPISILYGKLINRCVKQA